MLDQLEAKFRNSKSVKLEGLSSRDERDPRKAKAPFKLLVFGRKIAWSSAENAQPALLRCDSAQVRVNLTAVDTKGPASGKEAESIVSAALKLGTHGVARIAQSLAQEGASKNLFLAKAKLSDYAEKALTEWEVELSYVVTLGFERWDVRLIVDKRTGLPICRFMQESAIGLGCVVETYNPAVFDIDIPEGEFKPE